MWLVADSGSTKTEWQLFDKHGAQEKVSTKGLNPRFLKESAFSELIRVGLPKQWFSKVEKLWIYVAGADTDRIKTETASWLSSLFTQAQIVVNSDLLAAAHATCGTQKGIVAILGTGSNSALYDGSKIVEHIKPLGYILGDEGSGTALGKSLLRKLLRDQFPDDLTQSLKEELGLSYDEIMDHVYRSQWPNRFIASCTRCLHSQKDSEEIKKLINDEFDTFIKVLSAYTNASQYPLNFVGSVAYYFSSNLKEVVEQNGYTMGKVLQSPIDKLVNYHIKNEQA